MWLGAEAVSVFLAVTILLQTFLPPNRGALTVEEYSENFNSYLDTLGDFSSQLNEQGQWVERAEPAQW